MSPAGSLPVRGTGRGGGKDLGASPSVGRRSFGGGPLSAGNRGVWPGGSIRRWFRWVGEVGVWGGGGQQALVRLEGQGALLTGASGGIGRAIALALGEAGATVAVCA